MSDHCWYCPQDLKNHFFYTLLQDLTPGIEKEERKKFGLAVEFWDKELVFIGEFNCIFMHLIPNIRQLNKIASVLTRENTATGV